VDKFGDAYKATIAVFHGIIASWLFLRFSEIKIDEFYFVILLVFFSVANILVWQGVLRFVAWWRRTPPAEEASAAQITGVRYRASDAIGLTLVAIVIGLGAAYLYNADVVLYLASRLANWHTSSTDSPFTALFRGTAEHDTGLFDKRDGKFAKASNNKVMFRVYMKDSRIGYEGYPGIVPTRLEKRDVMLSPACRFSFEESDLTILKSFQLIDGPGVFLQLKDIAAIEVIDANKSGCGRLYLGALKE
jgi:hypothetical protein